MTLVNTVDKIGEKWMAGDGAVSDMDSPTFLVEVGIQSRSSILFLEKPSK